MCVCVFILHSLQLLLQVSVQLEFHFLFLVFSLMVPLWYKGQHVKNGVKLFDMCFPQRTAIFNYC